MPLPAVAEMVTTTGHGVAAPVIWMSLTYLELFFAIGIAVYVADAAFVPAIPLD